MNMHQIINEKGETNARDIYGGAGDDYIIEIEKDKNNYKKIIHKNGKIYGAIIQGDLSYADFFNIKENLEFTY